MKMKLASLRWEGSHDKAKTKRKKRWKEEMKKTMKKDGKNTMHRTRKTN